MELQRVFEIAAESEVFVYTVTVHCTYRCLESVICMVCFICCPEVVVRHPNSNGNSRYQGTVLETTLFEIV